MTPSEIISVINALKAKSQTLHPKASSITIADGPLIPSEQGLYAQIMAGIHEIIATANNFVVDVGGSPQVEEKDATSIATAYKDFVHMHQVLLHSLTAKAGLFTSHPVEMRRPVADVLRQEKDIMEVVGSSLLDVVPSKQTEIKSQSQSLVQTIRASYRAYEKT